MNTSLPFLAQPKVRQPHSRRYGLLLLVLVLLVLLPTQIYAQDGVTSHLTSLAWSPDGSQLASGTEDGTVLVWDTLTWETIATLEGHESSVISVAWSPNGRRLAAKGADGTVLVWDTLSWAALATLNVAEPVASSETTTATNNTTTTDTSTTTATTNTTTTTPTNTQSSSPARPGAADLLSFEAFGSWRRGTEPYGTFTQSGTPVQEGSFAGKLNYNFSGATAEDDFVIFTQRIAISGEPNLVQAWVNGDGSGHLFNTWIEDDNGEVWAVAMGAVTHTGWKQMTGAIDANSPWPSGRVYGPDNGAIDYPIRFLGLVVDRTNGSTTGMISFDDITLSVGNAPVAQTETPVVASTPDYCANIEAPPADSDVRIYIPNYTNETIWAAAIDFPGVLNGDLTFSAEPGKRIQYWDDASRLYAIMNENKEIIRIFVAGTGPTQCEEVRSTVPDTTSKLVFITFTNGTNETLYICRENERLDRCGWFNPGDVMDPHPMYPGGVYNFIGQDSGATMTYVATDATNQAATITK